MFTAITVLSHVDYDGGDKQFQGEKVGFQLKETRFCHLRVQLIRPLNFNPSFSRILPPATD